MELYRKEAIASFLQSEAGKVLHIGKLPYRNFSLFIVIFLICLFAFLRWGHYSQTEVVTGVLIPSDGYTRIFSGSGGVVDAFYVAEGDEGDKVKKLYIFKSIRIKKIDISVFSHTVAIVSSIYIYLLSSQSWLFQKGRILNFLS